MSKEKAISMSEGGLAQWRYHLQKLGINSPADLMNAVCEASEDGITLPTAKKAFEGAGVSKPYWERIFAVLGLSWHLFIDLHKWEKLTAIGVWKQLLAIAEDANDKFGLVLAPRLQESGCRDALQTHRYEAVISKGDHVLVEFPADLHGFLLLLEQNAEGGFDLVAPSCLMQNSFLDGNLRRLPQYPPAPVQSIQLDSLGIVSVWAGIFDHLPQWDWLAGAEKDMLSLDVEQLDEILKFAKSQNRATIWRSSYTVTAN